MITLLLVGLLVILGLILLLVGAGVIAISPVLVILLGPILLDIYVISRIVKKKNKKE
jgi:hypothetical protein